MPTLWATVEEASTDSEGLETGSSTSANTGPKSSMVDLTTLSDAELIGRMSGTPEEQEVVRRLQAVQHQLT